MPSGVTSSLCGVVGGVASVRAAAVAPQEAGRALPDEVGACHQEEGQCRPPTGESRVLNSVSGVILSGVS